MPPEAKPGFDDSAWKVVDTPHDMLIGGAFSPNNPESFAFLARGKGWYRKHMTLPAEWKGQAVWLYFEGAFHTTQAWLNGVPLSNQHGDVIHRAGYTSFWLRIDDKKAKFAEKNVLALHVDATTGTGWWYEGGGLMRHQFLVKASPLHLKPEGAWAYANVSGVSGGLTGKAVVHATATLENHGGAPSAAGKLQVRCLDMVGKQVGAASVATDAVQPEGTAEARVKFDIADAKLWTVRRPYLYTLVFEILGANGAVTDSVNVTTGYKTVTFDANKGLAINDEHVKIRGFCDHSNFGGVGGAVPDRINLFRTQALRAVGANAWRMAHNPPVAARMDYMDRLGMLLMDENRDFGKATAQESVPQEVEDMGDLVTRDRSRASLFIWSFCNEGGCTNESSAALFRAIAYKDDGSHVVTQNHIGVGKQPLSTESLDVQGGSHRTGADWDTFHKNNPTKPTMSTECCSCMSQRGEDADACPVPRVSSKPNTGGWCGHTKTGSNVTSGTFYSNEISECTATQVDRYDSREYLAGQFVWSGFDYLGEARGWPQVTKCRGTVSDVAGFRKETAWWMRSWWLSRIDKSDAGRPVGVADEKNSDTVYVVDAWRPGLMADGSPLPKHRTIHIYTNGATVAIEVNGKPQKLANSTCPSFGNWQGLVEFKAGNLTATAFDKSGKSIGSYTVMTSGATASIALSLDAPASGTGTGDSLVSDGQDVAMVRATLLDDKGLLASDAMLPIKFSISSGPGAVIATHNGDPACQTGRMGNADHDKAAAYHGLARAFVRSTTDHATGRAHRRRLREIDVDSVAKIADPDDEYLAAPSDIVIKAIVTLSDGSTKSATLTIPVSSDLAQLPINVAARKTSISSNF